MCHKHFLKPLQEFVSIYTLVSLYFTEFIIEGQLFTKTAARSGVDGSTDTEHEWDPRHAIDLGQIFRNVGSGVNYNHGGHFVEIERKIA